MSHDVCIASGAALRPTAEIIEPNDQAVEQRSHYYALGLVQAALSPGLILAALTKEQIQGMRQTLKTNISGMRARHRWFLWAVQELFILMSPHVLR